MKVKFRFDNPNDLQATLSVTLSIGQWKALREQLDSKHPSWVLSSAITDVINQAEEAFFAEHEADK